MTASMMSWYLERLVNFCPNDTLYERVLIVSLGYSGLLVAEHIAVNFPSDLKWAVAGRSVDKLKQVVSQCKDLAPNHVQPGITRIRAD